MICVAMLFTALAGFGSGAFAKPDAYRPELDFKAMTLSQMQNALGEMKSDCALAEPVKRLLSEIDQTLGAARIQCSDKQVPTVAGRDWPKSCFSAFLFDKNEFCQTQYKAAQEFHSAFEAQMARYSDQAMNYFGSLKQYYDHHLLRRMGAAFCRCGTTCGDGDETRATILSTIRAVNKLAADMRKRADSIKARCDEVEHTLRTETARRLKDVKEHPHVQRRLGREQKQEALGKD